ncbi:MAG: ATP-binding protein [Planctomycetota bacterium]|nr:ATP-binding protein [Planctomycetota bacterium]
MFRSRFFWKLYSSYAALLVVTSVLTGSLVHWRLKASLNVELEKTLESKCILLAPYARRGLESGNQVAMQSEVTSMGRETGTRFTLIRADGTVLADSDESPSQMENHSNRPEVQQALRAPFGMTRRFSQTVRYSMLYIARAVRDGEKVSGIVRVSIPLKAIDAQLVAVRETIVFGALAGLLTALVFGLIVTQRITRPIREMTEIAEDLRLGKYDHRALNVPNDEIGVLGDTLNRLGEEITSQVDALSREQAQLQAMISRMVEGVLAVDENDRVLLSNQAACDLLGVPGLYERGKPLWSQVRHAGLLELMSATKSSAQPSRGEIVFRRNGRERIFDAQATTFEGGETRGIVVVLHDITDLRRLEHIRRDFVANVSHELKTPLTAIKGYVETLLDGGLHDDQINIPFLKKTSENTTRLSNLVTDLLSLARIESEEGILKATPVPWQPVILDALTRHETKARQKNILMESHLPDSPVTVLGDTEGMTQILDNLLDNAIKYTSESGRIDVRLTRTDSTADLEVKDSGIGIPAKELDRIFERFYRVDKARSRELGGTGLGLSIVKHLAQCMNGQVSVKSEEGRGSSFTVSLLLATES